MVLAVFVLALALAPGLYAAAVQTGDFPSLITLPVTVDGETIIIQSLPALIEPELEAVPLPVPEAVATNPCDACFAYMTALIDQLTDNVISPEIEAHPLPEAEVLPEAEDEILEIVPHPMPTVEVVPEAEEESEIIIEAHPMPTVEVVPEAEQESEIVVEAHPMPTVEVIPESWRRN